MPGKNAADIVFVIDTSGSMSPCIDALRANLDGFLACFQNVANESWDVRLDFVAHNTGAGVNGWHGSVFEPDLHAAFYRGSQARFFTSDPKEVQKGLRGLSTSGNERSLVALDFALDAPWRDARIARRIVIFLTDEPHETSCRPTEDEQKIPELIAKIHGLKVMLFLVAPDSTGYEQLASADKADWERVPDGDGLGSVDMSRVLRQIAKSITASQTPLGAGPSVKRGIFGQAGW